MTAYTGLPRCDAGLGGKEVAWALCFARSPLDPLSVNIERDQCPFGSDLDFQLQRYREKASSRHARPIAFQSVGAVRYD